MPKMEIAYYKHYRKIKECVFACMRACVHIKTESKFTNIIAMVIST